MGFNYFPKRFQNIFKLDLRIQKQLEDIYKKLQQTRTKIQKLLGNFIKYL